MSDYPDDADGDALARIAAEGVDMSQPMVIDFAIAAPDGDSAKSIADLLTKNRYEVEVCFDEGEPEEGDEDLDEEFDEEEFGPSWTVYAKIKMVPTYEKVLEVQAELDRLAEPLGGYSDGWGVLF